ncbi:MAG: Holliday junction branch migration DNA helicase RuvB [Patescibacteria group bacterium]|nr:Holliday junction branch migration DNA helicase RuvB [Patescibacteria group bacterium]
MNKIKNRKLNDKEDTYLETLLRPSSWDKYIGQDRIKNNLKIMIEAAKKRKDLPDHLLFYGPQGLGKTTLAHLIAKEMNANLRVTSGVNLEKSGDLIAVLANLEPGDVLFIDETHRINRMIEEILYPAMENRKIHITVGKGPSARMLALDLPPFTLIGATIRINLLSAPLRSRFGAIFGVDYYNTDEIQKIIAQSAKIIGMEISDDATAILAMASRFTPRNANRLLKRVRDVAEVKGKKAIKAEVVNETLRLLEVDSLGLEKWDRRLIETVIRKFNGGPVGLNTLSAVLGEDRGVIEEIHEPFLIKMGLLQKTPSGRIATADAYEHLEIKNVKSKRKAAA